MSPSSKVAAQAARAAGLFTRTPLIKARALSQRIGKDVYFKLDNLQASGSFKDRGMAHLCHTLHTEQNVDRIISSSGGNAGLAVATVAPQLGMEVDVYVPETTKPIVVEKLQSIGAIVTIHGEHWNAADTLARQAAKQAGTSAAYASPYDNPLLWTGHSSVVDEILEDLPDAAAICVSVGGGGLLCGVLEGLLRHQKYDCRVIAAETVGANCYAKALENGSPVRLDAITSIATSLGALETTPVTLERTSEYKEKGGDVRSLICTDKQAVSACHSLATDQRWLVEPACGAALAAAYDPDLLSESLADVEGPIVLQVCGGSGVTVDLMQQWKQDLGL